MGHFSEAVIMGMGIFVIILLGSQALPPVHSSISAEGKSAPRPHWEGFVKAGLCIWAVTSHGHKLPPSLKSLIPLPQPSIPSIILQAGDHNKGLPSTRIAHCCQVPLYFHSHQSLFLLRTFNNHCRLLARLPMLAFTTLLVSPEAAPASPPFPQPQLQPEGSIQALGAFLGYSTFSTHSLFCIWQNLIHFCWLTWNTTISIKPPYSSKYFSLTPIWSSMTFRKQSA